MKKVQAARQRFAAAFALFALLAVATMDLGSAAQADTTEPDYLVLNPENE